MTTNIGPCINTKQLLKVILMQEEPKGELVKVC